jgi:hypothetical protein
MSIKVPDTSKPSRRLRKPIEPIHVEELLAGAGMSGFLGVLAPRVPPTHLEKLVREVDPLSTNLNHASRFDGARLAPSQMSARVASVVRRVEALTELIRATSRKSSGE